MYSQILSRNTELEFEWGPARNCRPETWKLFEDILVSGVSLRLRVTGRSMTPFLGGGEILTVRQVPAERLRIGDVVLFKDGIGNLVLHRLVRKKKAGDGLFLLQTKGDGLRRFDNPIFGHQVLGRVGSIEKGSCGADRSINMESLLWRSVNRLLAVTGIVKCNVYCVVFRQ